MNRLILIAIMAAFLFGSCRSEAGRLVVDPPEAPDTARNASRYAIIDYKSKARGGAIPEWVSLWHDKGANAVETLDAYKNRYVFVATNEANNFNALGLWKEGFSAELDFPRLAASRINERLASAVSDPDQGYGAFYEAMIRAASDFPWTGAVVMDDFWIYRRFESAGEGEEEGSVGGQETENWEFLVLVTIEKSIFASQFNGVFESINPNPPPTRDQRTAINRIKERFFDRF